MDTKARNESLPQHLYKSNSGNRFLDDFNRHEIIFVEDSITDSKNERRPKNSEKKKLLGNFNSKLGAGKLSKRSTNESDSATTVPPLKLFKDNTKENTNFQYLPVISHNNPPLQTTSRGFKTVQNENDKKPESYASMRLITGTIDYILKVHKSFPDLWALYEIYGKVIKISNGKFSCQRVYLLRNEIGPVLQAIYYEIDSFTSYIDIGTYVRCIGKFIGQSKLQIFKIKPNTDKIRNESTVRLENICHFTLKKIKER